MTQKGPEMPLSNDEREFLDAYVFEATHGPPFGGPATSDLARRGIRYVDLLWVLTAYDRERCAERRELPQSANPNPPPSPWDDIDEAKKRNQLLKGELDVSCTEGGLQIQGSKQGS